jgi:hypothetical protein
MNNNNSSSLVESPSKKFQENIQKWAVLENQIKTVNEKMKVIRDNKNKLTDEICQYIKTNNLYEKNIELSDGVIKMYEKKDYSPLTYTYIEGSLNKIISNKEHVEYIIKYLKENRQIKTSSDIKKLSK